MEFEDTTMIIIMILSVGLILGIGIFILGQLNDSAFTGASSISTSQTILTESSDSLTPIGTGITSSEVNANNRTWINCTTSDSLTVDINESKATVSVWFANSTTDWTSIIKSDGDIYIDGVLNPSWTFLPFFLAGDIITFCKSDGSTFLDVSVDAIRVYEQALNNTEVTQVYNYGR